MAKRLTVPLIVPVAGNFLDRRPIQLDGFRLKARCPKALDKVPPAVLSWSAKLAWYSSCQDV